MGREQAVFHYLFAVGGMGENGLVVERAGGRIIEEFVKLITETKRYVRVYARLCTLCVFWECGRVFISEKIPK